MSGEEKLGATAAGRETDNVGGDGDVGGGDGGVAGGAVRPRSAKGRDRGSFRFDGQQVSCAWNDTLPDFLLGFCDYLDVLRRGMGGVDSTTSCRKPFGLGKRG